MLLMKLQAKEKFSFLQLAHYLARIDNKYGQKEEEIILEYCAEMGIENLDSFDFENFSLDKILNDFKSETSKKIVILELMILIHIDHTFNLNEKKLIQRISESFGIEPISCPAEVPTALAIKNKSKRAGMFEPR